MTGEYLTPKQLKLTRACDTYRTLALQHLTDDRDDETEKREAVRACIRYSLTEPCLEGAEALWGGFMDGVYPLLPGVVGRAAGNETDFLVRRFMRWFYGEGYRVRGTDRGYSFEYGGVTVRGTADLEVEDRDGRTLFMDISFRRKEYVERTRKAENLVGNSIELLSMMRGLATPENRADCCIAYLKSRDDRSGNPADAFEKGRGKNLALMAYDGNAEGRLSEAMSIRCDRDCEGCRYRDACLTQEMAFEEGEAEEVDLARKLRVTDAKPSESQQRVIDHGDGPMVVLAVAGGGKTRALTERFARLVKDGVPVEKILSMTFTRKAAGELASRLGAVTGRGGRPESYTFHGLFSMLLRDYGSEADRGKLATTTKRKDLIMRAVSEGPVIGGLSYEYPELRHGLYNTLDTMFEAFTEHGFRPPENFRGDRDALREVWDIYRRHYAEEGFFTYDDIVRRAEELTEDPEVLSRIQERWTYFMVDEFQDVNPQIARTVYRMASLRNNLVVVGDDDQSIFGFNGGTEKYILEFTKEFPGAETVYMEDNYRTTARILDSAQSLISHNRGRKGKVLNSRKGDGLPPAVLQGFDRAYTAEYVKEMTKSWAPEDICVLARRNSDLENLARELGERGVKCLPPRRYLTDTQEFGVLHCFLKYYYMRENTPTVFLWRLLRYVGVTPEPGRPLYDYFDPRNMPECISDAVIAAGEPGTGAAEKVAEIFMRLSCFEEGTTELANLCDRICDEACGDLREAYQLLDKMKRFQDRTEVEMTERRGYVNLLTSHKSKGKEWKCVIIYRLEDYEADETERRLLYVSMTRAMECLTLIQTGEGVAPLLDEIRGLVPYGNMMAERRKTDAACAD